jgi:predicted Zn-dependent protease
MIGHDIIIKALSSLARKAKGEATAVCFASFNGLTRFANNYVHQNLHTHSIDVAIRAKIGKRIGIATTTGLEEENLENALRQAEAIAEASPPIEDLAPLAGMRAYRPVDCFHRPTASFSPEDRAKSVKVICDMAREIGGIASGLVATGYSEFAVVNSVGLRAYAPLSKAEVIAMIGKGHASGYASTVSRSVGAVDFDRIGRIAKDKCLAGEKRVGIEPGDYEVILEHTAVADALEWLSYIGFGSKSMEEGTSFLAGRRGEKIAQENITIYDDAYNRLALGMPFDFEGMPKMPVYFIKNGVAGSCVHTTQSAMRAKTAPTGHAPPPENSGEGATAMNIVMEPGDATVEEMIAGVKRGIYVTRFHYINGFIDTRNGVLTGMTRDGTFLIEDGKITAGLPNLRFMQSFLEAFNNTVQISKDRKPTPSWWGATGAYLTPAMRIENFRFIGLQKED